MKLLIFVDLCNEIMEGKISTKGYADFAKKFGIATNINKLIQDLKDEYKIVFVNLGFDENYSYLPTNSKLLGGLKDLGLLYKNTPSSDIWNQINIENIEHNLYYKSAISALTSMDLLSILSNEAFEDIIIAGVSTDIAIQSLARDLHDLNYLFKVKADCCIAASEIEHGEAIENLNKFCEII